MHTSVVKINGNLYDATTGHIISTAKSKRQAARQIMDGFVTEATKPAAKIASKTNLNSYSHQRQNQPKSTHFHQRADKTHTLMRNGLKKPASQLQTNLKRLSATPSIERQLRAKSTPKHQRVDHFGSPVTSRPAAEVSKKALSGEIVSSGHKATMVKAATIAAPLPSMIASASHQKLERLLDEALMRADSHKQALRYHAARHFWQRQWLSGPRKWASIAALLAIMTGSFFVAWHKVPQLSVKVAGMKAHLQPAVPSYKPEGYSMAGPAKAVMGAVTIKYVGNDGKQSYDITQTQSNLTSTMVANNIIPKGSHVQTKQIAGNTVYIYGADNDAAWVNNGVLYTIKDHANLRSDQLIKIVQGLNP